MKGFIKYLWSRKGKIFFLLFVNIFSISVCYIIIPSDDVTTLVKVLLVSFVMSVSALSFIQVWREYKCI